ncbi:MAG: DegT/DnrJ/EryC1/StrS family aminotransferase [candidate division Zixibacteria bacterium]|nr:DegT/DnrJ/EryC1/StrS family aminotransferase [candidate division Zixibacteria bacterium]
MAVPLLDLKRQYATIKNRMDAAVMKVLDHGLFILGPEVAELEGKIAVLSGARYGIGVASGTDALLLALRTVGVGAGDEVIVPDYSFISTTTVVSRLGAKPVFVDIEADTYNLDPNIIEAAITPKTRAIMPVHLFGQTADMNPILAVAKKHGLAVIEDAAQAIGAGYKDKKAGAIGDLGCFSFYPSKNLGGIGDGGMVIVSREEYRDMMKMLRVHGWTRKYDPDVVGYNSRLATIQAAALCVKLDYLAGWSEARRVHAAKYDAAFAATNIRIPVAKDYAYHIYNQYTIAVENREELMAALKEKNIGYDIYYPIPFHQLKCYADMGYQAGDFPASERASTSVVSIPVFPELTEAEQDEVIAVVKAVSA